MRGAVRGEADKTTQPAPALACPQDRVKRQFSASRPSQLRVADFTYVSTWQGFVYVAFVIDVYAYYIVGWRVSLIHHSEWGSQYVSIRYTHRLAEAGIEPFVGSRRDRYDNALPESTNGLYKAEVIHRQDPWKSIQAVELATLEWVGLFNHHRLLAPIGDVTPAEAEASYYQRRTEQTMFALLKPTGLLDTQVGSSSSVPIPVTPSRLQDCLYAHLKPDDALTYHDAFEADKQQKAREIAG